MPSDFTDLGTPRQRLAFEELPRGFVKFPERFKEFVERERAKFPPGAYTDQHARECLERSTLVYYYDGLPVAYRPAPDGIEVLALGWEETVGYWNKSDEGIKVVQP